MSLAVTYRETEARRTSLACPRSHKSWGSGSQSPQPRAVCDGLAPAGGLTLTFPLGPQASLCPQEQCAHGRSWNSCPCLPGTHGWSRTEHPEVATSPLQPTSGVTVEGAWTLGTDSLVFQS